MSKYIDADALKNDLEYDIAIDEDILNYVGTVGTERANTQFDKDCKQNAIDLLMNAPSIDIVFCKECKHRSRSGYRGDEYWVCDFMDAKIKDDDFCSYGAKEGE